MNFDCFRSRNVPAGPASLLTHPLGTLKTTLRDLLVIVAAFTAVLTFGMGTAHATTRWVNQLDPTPTPPGTSCAAAGYMTISAAIAAANLGDTIIVCPGVYLEQVNINKDNLTLLGAQANLDARTRPFVPANESIIDHPCG